MGRKEASEKKRKELCPSGKQGSRYKGPNGFKGESKRISPILKAGKGDAAQCILISFEGRSELKEPVWSPFEKVQEEGGRGEKFRTIERKKKRGEEEREVVAHCAATELGARAKRFIFYFRRNSSPEKIGKGESLP